MKNLFINSNPGLLRTGFFIILLVVSSCFAYGGDQKQTIRSTDTEHYRYFQKSISFLTVLDNQDVEKTISHFQAGFDEGLLKKQIFETWSYLVGTYGKYVSYSSLSFHKEFPETAVYGKLTFERRLLGLRLGFGNSGKLLDFRIITDLSQLPLAKELVRPYVDESKYRVLPFKIGSQDFPLVGNLYLPTELANETPVLVFTHDFGPTGMFQRVGVNTVFKDLAEGLASGGYPVLLYPKRSQVYADTIHLEQGASWEILEDLYSCLYHLKNRVEFKQSPIVHVSFGFSNYFVPFLLKKSLFDGHILLNPSFRHPLRVLFEDREYRAVFDETSPEELKALAKEIETFFGSQENGSETLFEYPAAYFKKLDRFQADSLVQTYRPVLTIYALSDHSYHSSDRFEVEKVLAGFKHHALQFPSLNRALQKSQSRNPELDYFTPGIVDPKVISGLISWLKNSF